MHHVLSAEQFDRAELEELFAVADSFRLSDRTPKTRLKVMSMHPGRRMVSMFYEPSTRTRFSFEIAGENLGFRVRSTENASQFSSAVKGETIEDTVRVLTEYGVDAIVMRTKQEGDADRAASASTVPIINGGDGKGEHPTQAALDIYTIHEQLGKLDNLNIVLGGDLAYGRTVRSLAKLLSLYEGNKITFVSTPELQIGEDIKLYLKDHGTVFSETTDMYGALREADVVYWTRLQAERHGSDASLSVGQDHFVLDEKALAIMPEAAIIMHPLPRGKELPVSTDADPRAKYFRQAGNGLYMRMAILDKIMKSRSMPSRKGSSELPAGAL